MGSKYDFHIHTSRSDGRYTARDLMKIVAEKGIEKLAITDHDTFQGFRDALDVIDEYGIELFSGIEISTSYFEQDKFVEEIHLLAYALDPSTQDVITFEDELRAMQNERALVIVDKLGKIGFNLDFKLLYDAAFPAPISVVPIITQLVYKGYLVPELKAIREFIREKFTPAGFVFVPPIPKLESVVRRCKELGGLLVFAHPFKVKNDNVREYLLTEVQGIEVFYSEHTFEETAFLSEKAISFNKLMTAGSDFHGHYEPSYEPVELSDSDEKNVMKFVMELPVL
jgi:3',5'-nucleoside bisphosphate phosphatase